jgi:hypothetical protein
MRVVLAALFLAMSAAPAFAQVDFSGAWASLYHEDLPERLPGPELGDYMGLPVNDAARLRGDSYDADRISVVPEYQCRPHGGDYQMRGLSNMRVDPVLDPVTQQLVAWHTRMGFQEMERTIWMDGRAHPPEWAPHTWQGFSTGKWEGDILTVYTTHIKQEWIRRNGIPNSDRSTMIEHFIRHGNILTHMVQWTDPVNLTEPLLRSEEFVLQERTAGNWLWPCEYVDEVADRPRGEVPHYLPGKSPYAGDFAWRYGVPLEAAAGGAETMYPEYRDKLRTLPKPTKPAPR